MGPGRRSEQTGELIPVDVAVGDVVLYSKYGGTEVSVDGEDLLVLSSRDVLAKLAGGRRRSSPDVWTCLVVGARSSRRPPEARAPETRHPGPGSIRRTAGPVARRRPPALAPALPPPPPAVPPLAAGRHPGAAVLCRSSDGADGEARLVLTKRPDTMPSHRGEIAFPGRQDRPRVDATPRDAALREAEEEIGLPREPRSRSSPSSTRSAHAVGPFVIAPFVGLIVAPRTTARARPPRGRLGSSTSPCRSCSDPDVYHEESWDVWASTGRMHFFELAGETVWGATARILADFLVALTGDRGTGARW